MISSCQTKLTYPMSQDLSPRKGIKQTFYFIFVMWFVIPSERNSAVKLRNENQMVHNKVLKSIVFNR